MLRSHGIVWTAVRWSTVAVPEKVRQELGETHWIPVIKQVAVNIGGWHPATVPILENNLVEIPRTWESFSVKRVNQEKINRGAVFRMNPWIFGNFGSPIDALPGGLNGHCMCVQTPR
jgi:hypothetical protein